MFLIITEIKINKENLSSIANLYKDSLEQHKVQIQFLDENDST
jgi:hypothetical protein